MKKAISILKQWFTWRFFPRSSDLSVKSIIETILYGIVFAICCFYFYNWNQVPVRHESITVDCLSKPQTRKKIDIAPIVRIEYCIPMTSTDWEPQDRFIIYDKTTRNLDGDFVDVKLVEERKKPIYGGLNISFSQWATNYHMVDSTGVIKSDLRNYEDAHSSFSCRDEETGKSEFWESLFSNSEFPIHGKYPYDMSESTLKGDFHMGTMKNAVLRNKRYFLYHSGVYDNFESKRDSLLTRFRFLVDSIAVDDSVFRQHWTYKVKETYPECHPIYYFKHISSCVNTLWDKKIESTSYAAGKSFCGISSLSSNGRFIRTIEGFGAKSGYDKNTGLDFNHICTNSLYSEALYLQPGWFRLEDISQAYYDVKVNSTMIDSIVLHFDFVGATTFSKMTPEPDEITMSSITFSDPEKLLDIRLHGLKFHARFVELENRQYIRLFAITAIMGGMVTIFLAMLIIGGLNFVKKIKDQISIARLRNRKNRP